MTSENSRGPRGPYAKSAQLRKEILDACVTVFADNGFHGSTMSAIAQRAGIGQTRLLHHFASKAELLTAMLASHEQRMAEIIESTGSGEDALRAHVREVGRNRERRDLVQLHSIISAEAAVAAHPAHEVYRTRYDQLRLHLTGVFAELRGAGRLKVGTRPDILASQFIAMMDGLQLQWLYSPTTVDVADHLDAFLSTLLIDDAD
ncbi:TetR/AcrR family transcriptional regulator [Actinoplanes couchii]|uniref:TetR/AcrR family transcriptional regulator n=1 Tax=Actinoplanes couchii TaxID=403638 RepID=UPI00194507BA|nr:TetR/AcrR family transcriptional regulator [Actinoplanes couchii]MDR6318771.1 AcrR family transcriptional regulator [Actinoplanes couchii]